MVHHHHSSTQNIKTAFLLNLGFTIIEIIGGILTNSIAILSDALHDLGDSLSLGLAWYLDRYAQRSGNEKYSYGYGRFSLLGAFINVIVLMGGSVIILWQAIPRLFNPETAHAPGMIGFAIAGIVVNGLAALRLQGEESLNARVVAWHLLEDVVGWVAVLVAGIILLFVDWPIIDPILAILLTSYILFNVARNLRKTVSLFLQATPDNIDLAEIETQLANCAGVLSSHDTHIWSLDGEHHVLSTHLVVDEQAAKAEIVRIKQQCKAFLMNSLHLAHVTIEIEFACEDCLLRGGPAIV